MPQHFWEARTACAVKVGLLRSDDMMHNRADTVRHAWASICNHYFPATTNSGTCYNVERQAYRGPKRPDDKTYTDNRPNVVVSKVSDIQKAPNRGYFIARERDCLWVECRSPSARITPASWKALVKDVAEKLRLCHPKRMLYVILAIKTRWLIFQWDPSRAKQPPLRMWQAEPGEYWELPDSRLRRPMFNSSASDAAYFKKKEEKWYIDTNKAGTLDYWTLAPTPKPIPKGYVPQPYYSGCLKMLGNSIMAMQKMSYGDRNTESSDAM
ncbi:hypothetical protein B9Z65_6653 [Elsinoe australis]|uniref:Uncharacterized protein n=1 Tax=Elsinoe australis TaxID=40998 RepID=A0A2P8ADW0_9PEZI|nr:hypothetical protein B9Z65_6653 [Elsinoe australis]